LPEFLVNTLTHPAFTAIVGFVAGHFFAIGRDRRKEFNDASEKLRDAFAPELSTLKNPTFDTTIDPYNLLLGAFDKHRTAVVAFSHFLKEPRKRQFNQTWLKYYAHGADDEGDKTEFLIKYSPGWESKPIRECRDAAIFNIEKLLEFADHK